MEGAWANTAPPYISYSLQQAHLVFWCWRELGAEIRSKDWTKSCSVLGDTFPNLTTHQGDSLMELLFAPWHQQWKRWQLFSHHLCQISCWSIITCTKYLFEALNTLDIVLCSCNIYYSQDTKATEQPTSKTSGSCLQVLHGSKKHPFLRRIIPVWCLNCTMLSWKFLGTGNPVQVSSVSPNTGTSHKKTILRKKCLANLTFELGSLTHDRQVDDFLWILNMDNPNSHLIQIKQDPPVWIIWIPGLIGENISYLSWEKKLHDQFKIKICLICLIQRIFTYFELSGRHQYHQGTIQVGLT